MVGASGAVQASRDSRNHPQGWLTWVVDKSLGDQLRQRAAMGGEKERAELAAFGAVLSKGIAEALVPEVRKEAQEHGVEALTWLTRLGDRRRRDRAAL
jgi:hypothetical protein